MLTPVKAIRAYCVSCCREQPQEVRLCPASECPLYPYRMGHNPNRAGIGGKPELEPPETCDCVQLDDGTWIKTA